MDLLPYDEYIATLPRKRMSAGVLTARRARRLAWIFDGGLVTDEQVARFTLEDPEVLSVGLYGLAEASSKVSPRVARQIHVALRAVRPGDGPVLCDDGVPEQDPPGTRPRSVTSRAYVRARARRGRVATVEFVRTPRLPPCSVKNSGT